MNNSKQDVLHVYGRQAVIEALKARVKIYNLWLAKDLQGPGVRHIQSLAAGRNIAVQTVSKDDIQRMVGPVVHQGVVIKTQAGRLLSDKEFDSLLKKEQPLFLVLDQIQDPHNLGAILRTADITNVDAVIVAEKGSADLSATVAKTSAGAMFHVPLYRAAKIQPLLEKIAGQKVQIFAMLHTAERLIYQQDFSGGVAVIIGNEGRGVRKNLLSYCTQTLRIPQFGKVNSLNASVSAGVVLYEIIRQRLNG